MLIAGLVGPCTAANPRVFHVPPRTMVVRGRQACAARPLSSRSAAIRASAHERVLARRHSLLNLVRACGVSCHAPKVRADVNA